MPFKSFLKYCKQCNVQLHLRNNRDIVRRNFCSHSCRATYVSNSRKEFFIKNIIPLSNTPEANAKKSHKGCEHPCWIVDRTQVKAKRPRNLQEQWRRLIFERDNYTCQICLIRGGKLQAHHKMPVAKFPQYRNVIWNGMTVCELDHKEIHHSI